VCDRNKDTTFNCFLFLIRRLKKNHDTKIFTCLCSCPWGFLLRPSLKPVAPPLFGPSKPHFNKASMGSKARYLQCLSAQSQLRISRQSMNRHSSKWPTDSLSEVSYYRLLISAGTHVEFKFVTPTMVKVTYTSIRETCLRTVPQKCLAQFPQLRRTNPDVALVLFLLAHYRKTGT